MTATVVNRFRPELNPPPQSMLNNLLHKAPGEYRFRLELNPPPQDMLNNLLHEAPRQTTEYGNILFSCRILELSKAEQSEMGLECKTVYMQAETGLSTQHNYSNQTVALRELFIQYVQEIYHH